MPNWKNEIIEIIYCLFSLIYKFSRHTQNLTHKYFFVFFIPFPSPHSLEMQKINCVQLFLFKIKHGWFRRFCKTNIKSGWRFNYCHLHSIMCNTKPRQFFPLWEKHQFLSFNEDASNGVFLPRCQKCLSTTGHPWNWIYMYNANPAQLYNNLQTAFTCSISWNQYFGNL